MKNYDEDWGTVTKEAGYDGPSKKTPAGGSKTAAKQKAGNPERNTAGETEKDTAIAVAALVFGILSLLTAWLLGGIGFTTAALVCAGIVLKRKYYGKGYAVGGLVCAVISFFVRLALLIFLIVSAGRIAKEAGSYLTDGLMDALSNDYLYDFVEERGEEFIRDYIDEYGSDLIDSVIQNYLDDYGY